MSSQNEEKNTTEKSEKEIEKLDENTSLLITAIKNLKKADINAKETLSKYKPALITSLLSTMKLTELTKSLISEQARYAALASSMMTESVQKKIRELNKQMAMALLPVRQIATLAADLESKKLPFQTFSNMPIVQQMPERNDGIKRATNAYIEALEKELEKEREKNNELLKIIKELKEPSSPGYAI